MSRKIAQLALTFSSLVDFALLSIVRITWFFYKVRHKLHLFMGRATAIGYCLSYGKHVSIYIYIYIHIPLCLPFFDTHPSGKPLYPSLQRAHAVRCSFFNLIFSNSYVVAHVMLLLLLLDARASWHISHFVMDVRNNFCYLCKSRLGCYQWQPHKAETPCQSGPICPYLKFYISFMRMRVNI